MMEALMMLLSAEMPVEAMADLLDEHDTRLWRVLMHYVEQAHAKSDWSALRRIAVDETSARRGHRYVTNVLDAENSRLLLMVEGRSAEALRAFAKAPVEHGGDPTQIEAIAMDMRDTKRNSKHAKRQSSSETTHVVEATMHDGSPTLKVFFVLLRGRRGPQRALNSVSCLLLYRECYARVACRRTSLRPTATSERRSPDRDVEPRTYQHSTHQSVAAHRQALCRAARYRGAIGGVGER